MINSDVFENLIQQKSKNEVGVKLMHLYSIMIVGSQLVAKATWQNDNGTKISSSFNYLIT